MKKRIDFERVKSQELKLNAIDRGGRIGSATIHVIIDDENDNDPMFTKDKYRIQITESTPIGEVSKYWFGVGLFIKHDGNQSPAEFTILFAMTHNSISS